MSILHTTSSGSKLSWQTKPLSATSLHLKPVILQNSFLIPQGQQDLQEISLSLTPNHIYYKPTPNSLKKLKIKWSIIESFYEDVSGVNLYGFSVITPQKKHDFFTPNDKILETWLESLSKHCFLSGFEQDFMIIKTIDSSKTGNVSLCQDLITSTKYAVKIINKNLIRHPDQIMHLKHEIKSMRRANHQNITSLYRVYEEQDSLNLILEYIPGGNLLTRLQTLKQFKEFEVALIAKSLIDALCHLNNIGVVHRDLKLENILISESNNFDVKIADFGLASCSKKVLTDKCGSPGFMAPEMLAGDVYDGKFDVFSVGIVCFALLSGKLPFSGKSIKEIIDKNEKCKVKFEQKTWKGCSEIAVNFVQGLMNKDKRGRPSAEQASTHPWLSVFLESCKEGKERWPTSSDIRVMINY